MNENIGGIEHVRTWKGAFILATVHHWKKEGEPRCPALWRSDRICTEKWFRRGFQAKRTARQGHEGGKGAVYGGEWGTARWAWMMAPGLCLASAAEATLLLALLPLHTWKVATSFTTSLPFYAHCSFLFGQSDHPFYEEPLGLWQMPLGHHHIHSAHLLHLDSGSRGLHAHNRELHQVCLTASLYFSVSGFLQSSENVPSPIQEQPERQGSLPSRGPPLKYGKEDSVGPWPRVSFFGGRLPCAGGWNPSATVVTTPVAHPLFITLIVVGLSFSPVSLHLYFNPVSWDHLPNKLSASRSLWQKPKLICDTQLSPSYDFLKSSSKVTGNVSGAMAPSTVICK